MSNYSIKRHKDLIGSFLVTLSRDKQADTSENITSLVEVKRIPQHSVTVPSFQMYRNGAGEAMRDGNCASSGAVSLSRRRNSRRPGHAFRR